MKLLLLSFYFRPDLSAGSFRSSALVEALLTSRPDIEIEIVTTLPNRYNSFSNVAPTKEILPRLTIHRIKLPPHQSGMVDQARAFLIFARGALRIVRRRRYDLVFATSSRLMTAALGASIARRLRVPLYLDIRDIFVDTIKDVLPRFSGLAKALFGPLERWTIKRADGVNLVSRGFVPYFERRYPGKCFRTFPNGVDDAFLKPLIATEPRADKVQCIVYAGNIGDGQGLHAILPALAKVLVGVAQFRIIGDGGRRQALARALDKAGVYNVEILPPISRDELLREYEQADILFLHLNDYPAFHKVLPSKLFEYAATGKPILAGMVGYPATFAQAEIANCAVFAPGDVGAALAALEVLRMGTTNRTTFVHTFARARIMAEMAADIVATAKEGAEAS